MAEAMLMIRCPQCKRGAIQPACDPHSGEIYLECTNCAFEHGPIKSVPVRRRQATTDADLTKTLSASLAIAAKFRPGDYVRLSPDTTGVPVRYMTALGRLDRYSEHGGWWWVRFEGSANDFPIIPACLVPAEGPKEGDDASA